MKCVHLQKQHALYAAHRRFMENGVQMDYRRGTVSFCRKKYLHLLRSNSGPNSQDHVYLELIDGQEEFDAIVSLLQKVQVRWSMQERKLPMDCLEIRLCQPLGLF